MLPAPTGHVTDLRRRGGKGANMTTAAISSVGTSRKAGTIAGAALLGVLFIYVVGFLPVETMHAYAHDTRHTVTAPCH